MVHGTRGAFQEIVLDKREKAEFSDKAIIQNSTGAVREAVSQDVNAIGYISLGGLNDTVKGVKVGGTEATVV
jgi:phosphate transport system substrate-binding protein